MFFCCCYFLFSYFALVSVFAEYEPLKPKIFAEPFYLYTGINPFLWCFGFYLYIGITLSDYNIPERKYDFNSQFSRRNNILSVHLYKTFQNKKKIVDKIDKGGRSVIELKCWRVFYN
jgi:hypothetical protein